MQIIGRRPEAQQFTQPTSRRSGFAQQTTSRAFAALALGGGDYPNFFAADQHAQHIGRARRVGCHSPSHSRVLVAGEASQSLGSKTRVGSSRAPDISTAVFGETLQQRGRRPSTARQESAHILRRVTRKVVSDRCWHRPRSRPAAIPGDRRCSVEGDCPACTANAGRFTRHPPGGPRDAAGQREVLAQQALKTTAGLVQVHGATFEQVARVVSNCPPQLRRARPMRQNSHLMLHAGQTPFGAQRPGCGGVADSPAGQSPQRCVEAARVDAGGLSDNRQRRCGSVASRAKRSMCRRVNRVPHTSESTTVPCTYGRHYQRGSVPARALSRPTGGCTLRTVRTPVEAASLGSRHAGAVRSI